MEDNTNNKSLKECALEYVNNGFALVPIAEKQKTKMPQLQHCHSDREIKQEFTRY